MMASALGVEGHALLIDTDSLAVTPIPFPEDLRVVVCDTGMDRALAGSAYNQRRAECEAACAELGISSLREAQVAEDMHVKDPIARKRARHVLTENERCLDMAHALRRRDRGSIGDLMAASHISLRDDYEVSSPELDAMVKAAQRSPGYVGARMTGAGFGGCAVAICVAEKTAEFLTSTEQNYLNIVKRLRAEAHMENHRLPVPRVLAARPAQGSGPIVALGS
jgi:galactokinase